MNRGKNVLVSVGVLALAVVVGLILNNVWLGLLLGVIVGLGLFIGFESRRGRNQGVNDDDNGIEL
ncbi:hypothetical protein N8K70_02390 [Microbacterium betulae]|uniref:Uncharacterized protein n=1 Tax=Microbacterium betulae TaxID=2981139 RepID=A0AA97I6V2_9MICO|nr:hypothetical protein [Microbacterium sp. AB]WOF23547.1 hypothetical protein N8K70_02390 [Microbacterium sp. AB]